MDKSYAVCKVKYGNVMYEVAIGNKKVVRRHSNQMRSIEQKRFSIPVVEPNKENDVSIVDKESNTNDDKDHIKTMEEPKPGRINFISCVKWVRQGVAKGNPEKVRLNKQELVRLINETKLELQTSGVAEQQSSQMNVDDEFNLQGYDQDDGIVTICNSYIIDNSKLYFLLLRVNSRIFEHLLVFEQRTTAQLLGISSLAEIEGETEDHFSESDDSDKEDDEIKPEDNLILAGRVEEDCSTLEIYVYNPSEESLYVHHDFILSAYPLCLEWLDYEPDHSPGNYCAIGTMSSIIEVWDLDIINCIEPAYKLGKKPKKHSSGIGHYDAVLDLAWNKNFHHILGSASVDKSILLWDLDEGTPATTINAFNDKVQCLEWKIDEAQTLLAGGSDKTIKLFDCRHPEDYKTWKISGEAEKICWNPFETNLFLVGTNNGNIHCFDSRQELAVWTITEAHEKDVTGLNISPHCPGLLLTCSADESVKIWDYTKQAPPSVVYERNFQMNIVHCLDLCPDLPFVLAAGGDNKMNNFTVFDLQNIDVVQNVFGNRELIRMPKEDASME
ncbi:hypothetical protein FQA39_LY06438 [Lamprigera yunnana]|nr:hypothetical protein FQA39_LY06438 [Lamprigera yunnana]